MAQLCPSLYDLMDCSPPGSSVYEDSPSKYTGVSWHALLQGIPPTQGLNPGLLNCRQILSHLSHQRSPRILEWVAYLFSRGSSQPRNQTCSPTLQADSLPAEPSGKPKNTGVGSLSLLQRIFPTQGSNRGFLHCRRIL